MAIAGIASGIMTGGGLGNMLLGIYPPLSTAYSKWAYSKWPNMIPGIGDLVEMVYRDEIEYGEFLGMATQNGFSSEWAERFFGASTLLLPVGDYLKLWRRGKITSEELDTFLHKQRFSPPAIEHLKQASEFFPSPQDLISFAVREVYSPDIVEKFGQMQDIPDKYLEEAAKTGLPEDQAKNLWAAHWLLPGASQGFDMLHRDIIDEPTLEMLLTALDIMPYWREMLIKLSYNPLTRVDVRRMHAMHVLEDKGVFDAYRAVGYSPDNAELMLDFTKRYNSDEGTGLTRATVQKSYKIGLITEEQFRDFLKSFGYTDDVVEYWFTMTEYEKSLAEIEAIKKELFLQYRVGSITLDEVRQELGYKGLPAAFVEQAIKEETAMPSEKIKMPTRTDLERWLLLQIIDEVIYSSQMKALGYRQTDIENYLTEITLKVDTSVRKYLPIKTYQRWLASGILSEDDFTRIAGEMKIIESDILLLIIEVRGE
jgi:hypothetical protein